jgi:tRNA dimethylallyltransferase
MEISLSYIKNQFNSIVILGPTACGKTRVAARLAVMLNGHVISADSRQVYTELDIGCGKDSDTYQQESYTRPVLGINLSSVREKYFVHQYRNYLYQTFTSLHQNNEIPVICGGTGLYLQLIYNPLEKTQVPENPELREKLERLDKKQLFDILKQFETNKTNFIDTSSKKRIIRGIEILEYLKHNTLSPIPVPDFKPYVIGILPDKSVIKNNIYERLMSRWKNGLRQEVEKLLQSGVSSERLIELGLEYKYVTLFLTGKMDEQTMLNTLYSKIVEFSRRQTLWFRKMEKEGLKIHWIKSPDHILIRQ